MTRSRAIPGRADEDTAHSVYARAYGVEGAPGPLAETVQMTYDTTDRKIAFELTGIPQGDGTVRIAAGVRSSKRDGKITKVETEAEVGGPPADAEAPKPDETASKD